MLNLHDFSPAADGKTKDTLPLQLAIDRCSILGGGTVNVPAGTYLTGALRLRSNVTLHLEKDAILQGSPDFADYPVSQVRWEGKWIPGHVGLIYAFDSYNIAVTGPGKIVGNPALAGRPSAQNPLRHPALIEPINCVNVRLEDFSTEYRSMWSIHPTYCTYLLAKNLTIRSTGGNGDGIDVDSTSHVVIDSCDISTGDDCISIKSGRGMEGYTLLKTSEDVLITHCTLSDAIFACVGIGSETSGGIRDVHIEHCKMTHAQTFALYIKSRPGRGAFIENISADDIDASGMVQGFLRFNILGSGIQDPVPVPGNEGIPTIRNFKFTNIRVTDCPLLVDGASIHPNKPLDGLLLANITGTCRKGISLANIKNAVVRDINVTLATPPLLSVYNVTGAGIDDAAKLPAPRSTEPIPPATQPYYLR
jgi:polygalacturonase